MRDLRVLVIDDEPLVRRGIIRFLTLQPNVAVVGEAGDGARAVAAIAERRPDLVFLDVQMPEADGFDVLAALEAETRPAVIFVTAYDQYAIRAFEVHAVDYLLKPFDEDRLAVALSRARKRLASGSTSHARVDALLEALRRDRPTPFRFMVRTAGRIYFVDADEVDWIEAAGNYVRLHVGANRHLVRDSLKQLESRMSTRGFARIHRSAMVNVNRIKELIPQSSGDCMLVLTTGPKLRLSRTHREALERAVRGYR
jgi:two-component system LytT family response regulator